MNYDKQKRKKERIEQRRIKRLETFSRIDFIDMFNLKHYYVIDNQTAEKIKKVYGNLELFAHALKEGIRNCLYNQQLLDEDLEHDQITPQHHSFYSNWLTDDREEYEEQLSKLEKYLLSKQLDKELKTNNDKKKVNKI